MTTEEFIRSHCNDDVRLLALQAARHPYVDMPYALGQIAGWQTARRKLPSWAALDGIVYPPRVSMEQCSGELAAGYKAHVSERLVRKGEGSFVDLTGGFGVDFSFMSRGFRRAVYVERQERLCDAARRNFSLLGLGNAEVVCGDCVEYLHTVGHVSLIYLDPSRRDSHGTRKYAISECTPDVLSVLPGLLAKSDRVMVKLSPMLDWHAAADSFNAVCHGCVAEVHIVSVHNECKEMLVVMAEDNRMPLTVYCVDLDGKCGVEPSSSFSFALPQPSGIRLSPYPPEELTGASRNLEMLPDTLSSAEEEGGLSGFSVLRFPFLYEPGASIMKAGCFAQLCSRYGVRAVGRNSRLFVSAEKVEDFPGRRFRIAAVSSMNRRELKKALAGVTRANITVRNFPLSVDELRKRLKLKDGGDTYIFATTAGNGRHLLVVAGKV